jgi:hypothetical protein
MDALKIMTGLLNAQPWPVRCKYIIHIEEKHVTIQAGAKQFVARELDGGQVELLYEIALHEANRERLFPELAAKRVLEILQRGTEL